MKRDKKNKWLEIIIITICLIVVSNSSFLTNFDVKANTHSNELNNDKSIKVGFIESTDTKIESNNKLFSNIPVSFIENFGQLNNNHIRFYSSDGGLGFAHDEILIKLHGKKIDQDPKLQVKSNNIINQKQLSSNKNEDYIIKQTFIGANHVKPAGQLKQSHYSNFFYGNNPAKWRTEVPNYKEIIYRDLYPNIDLVYRIIEEGIKYEFIVHQGGHVQDILIEYEGAEITTDGATLFIKTPIRTIIDDDFYSYQIIGNEEIPVESNICVKNNIVYYDIEYDPTYTLIIDPIIYSTFIGGSDYDKVSSIALDSSSNTYVTGATNSSNFTTISGSYDTSLNGGYDAFIFKLDKMGSSLIYSTYIGGGNDEFGNDIKVDSNGNVFLTGETYSINFPTTSGAFSETYSGTNLSIAFILKLNSGGNGLTYSTFVGGKGSDHGYEIDIDSTGNAYIVGSTSSSDFPTTTGSYAPSYSSKGDAFVSKLNQQGSSLIYSTYLGGNSIDIGYSIAVDTKSNATITGITNSSNYPTTSGSSDTTYNGGGWDIFVTRLNQIGSSLVYSTFVGGNDFDCGNDIRLDLSGNAIVTGQTNSSNFPTTLGAFDVSYNGNHDAIIFKLGNTGSSLLFSTFLGGNELDRGTGIDIDASGEIYITGLTGSADFPITTDALKTACDWKDSFFIKLDTNGSSLFYSTFLGGINNETNQCIVVDSFGDIFLSGSTNSNNFPTTSGAFDVLFNGFYDAYITRFRFPITFKIASASLLINSIQTNIIYSRLSPYTFRIGIIDPDEVSNLSSVHIMLDRTNSNIRLKWDKISNQFSELNDPNDYVTLNPSNSKYQKSQKRWLVDFNLTFNWNYPDEKFHDLQVYLTRTAHSPLWLNITGFYRVENDLMFNGSLVVKGENNRSLKNGDNVRGGELLFWTGLVTVYENTTDIYPPTDEFNVTIVDEYNNNWSDSPNQGEEFKITTITPNNKSILFCNYHIIITGIPNECDASNESFLIKIGEGDISFSNPVPEPSIWQLDSQVQVGITITANIKGGLINGSTIMHQVSLDNGVTWDEWVNIPKISSAKSVNALDTVLLKDGRNNLIKWRAFDTVGNGPFECMPYQVIVDTKNVKFSNPKPLKDKETSTKEVEIEITITDDTSGVDTSTIGYSLSYDSGRSWKSWVNINTNENGNRVDIRESITFPNGTGNRIKWRASDIAGNGPFESEPYTIKVNEKSDFDPELMKVVLQFPKDKITIPTNSVELKWKIENKDISGIFYTIYLDTINPPISIKEPSLTVMNLWIEDLIDGQTYFWTVIPKNATDEGKCLSGVWSFTVNTSTNIPIVALLYPENNTIISTLSIEFSWELQNSNLIGVTYDLILDTKYPPVESKASGLTLSRYTIENLNDGVTYYWTIIPKIGDIDGLCIDTYWKFTLNFNAAYPIVSLISPKNGSIVKSLKPSLLWSVNYDGLEQVTYDIYIDSNENPEMKMGSYSSTQFIPEDNLENQKTYYWRIVPKAENIIGPSSEVWSFTTKAINDTDQKDGKEIYKPDEVLNLFYIIIILVIIILLLLFTIFLMRKRSKMSVAQKPDSEEVEQKEVKIKPKISQKKQLVEKNIEKESNSLQNQKKNGQPNSIEEGQDDQISEPSENEELSEQKEIDSSSQEDLETANN
jgi:hypothetical protein